MTEHSVPDAELDVMASLWRLGQATAGQLRDALRGKRPLAHTSVCTLLKRLESKGLVVREKASAGKAFVYRPSVKPAGMGRRLLGDLLDRVFGGSGVALVASLLESRPPTEDELKELRQLLDQLRDQSRGSKPRGKQS
jgi:predicted transcriptional regulator